jgi:uncharacterized protein DUF4382
MTRKLASLFALLPLALLLASCSGLPVQNTCPSGNCNQTGNANVSVTVFDAPPAGVDFVTFNIPITGVTLSSAAGPVNVFSPTNSLVVDVAHLQSDSAALGTFQIPAGTYTAINVSMNSPFALYANSSSTTFPNCPPFTLCNLAGGAGQASFTFTSPLTLSGNQNVGLGLEFNLSNAIVSSGSQISINVTAANVLTAVTLPRSGQAAGTLDTIEDFVGTVKTVSGSTITVQNDAGITLAGAVGSATTFDAPPPTNPVGSVPCGGTFNQACVAVGQTVSIDATVSTSGTIAITNLDFLDIPAADEIEGTIFTTSTPGTFLMAVDHKVLASGSTNATILGPVSSGFKLNIILDPSATFAVDTSNLPIANSLTGFLSSSDLVTGQRVMAHVKSVSSGALLNVTTDRLVLRFSRFTGTPGTVSGSFFGLQNPPSYLGINPATPPQVQTFVPQTIFDGVTDITGLNGIATPISIRALYLNPFNGVQQPLLAAKVRKH